MSEPLPDRYPNLPVRVRRLAHLMDDSIRLPGGYRIGWDALLGLIPVVGDVSSAAVSVYIVGEAARAGASRIVLARMCLNILLETVVGAIPIAGDVFDAAFKANIRNLNLLDRHLAPPESKTRQESGWRWLAAGFAVVISAVAVVVALLLH